MDTRPRSPWPVSRATTVVLLIVGLGGSAALLNAAPQDALGDGRGLEHRSGSGSALDRSLQQGSGGRNVGNAQEDLRARNLVVTGNVAGGRGFRGDVGYSGEKDFRGSTSDDASYRFRSDSAFSDARFARSGSTGDRLGLARSYGSVEYARAANPGSSLAPSTVGTRLMFDQTSAQLLTPETRRSMMDLSTMKSMTAPDGSTLRIQSSGFGGIRSFADRDAVDGLELGLYDAARMKSDLRDGKLDKDLKSLQYQNPLAPEPLEGSVDPNRRGASSRVPGSSATLQEPTRIETGIKSMDTIVSQVERKLERDLARSSGTPLPEGTGRTARELEGQSDLSPAERLRREFTRDLDSLRRELRGDRPAPKDDEEEEPRAAPRPDPTKGEAPAAASQTRSTRSVEEMVEVLRHGQSIDRLSDSTVERVREIMESGESAMRRQAYFLAEQHFTTVLTLSPSNPLARLGLANAQLGAGLFGSSAITLRELFISHPELIDARLAPDLLPPPDRLRALLTTLESTPTDARNAADVGLMTAYIGRQLGDEASIVRGLDLLARGSPADATASKLLRGIWLGGAPTGAGDDPKDAPNAPAGAAVPGAAPAAAPAADPQK